MKNFLSHINTFITALILLVGAVGYGQQNPIIESINVENNGDVTIKWKTPPPGQEDDTYIILRWDYPEDPQDGEQPIETVNASDLSYIDRNSRANQKKQIYRIKLLEGDLVIQSEEMQTIFLEENIVYDECELTNTIRFTEFFSTFSPIDYRISASINGGIIYTEIETIAASDLDVVDQISTYENASPAQTNIYEYTHQNLDPDNIYTYKVEAIYSIENITQSSSSNLQSLETPAYDRPEPPVIKHVSVGEDGQIILEGEITGSGVINGLEVWRTESENSINLAAYQSLATAIIGPVNYEDTEASTSETAYWYDLVLLDYCYKKIYAETPHRSIFLTAEALPDESVFLSWNVYQGWPVQGYRVYRKFAENTFEEIDFVNIPNYTDNSISQSSEAGNISYYVMAEAIAGQNITSSSNLVNLGFDSELYMPNAFRPGGITDVFKPISRFEPNSDYLFQIYNRWGQLIFETRDFNEGWDGNYNGSRVNRGTYIWTYQYADSQGNEIKKGGSVTVVY